MEERKMPKVKVNDIEMYYEKHGEGFPLISIAGTGGTVEMFPEEAKKECSKHFKLILFDNRGAGRTDKPDMKYSMRMMADDTVGLMDALGIEKAHIMGTSMGGMIAQELAINYPEKVEKLILNCTSCGDPLGGRSQEALDLIDALNTAADTENWKEVRECSLKLSYTQKYIEENKDYLLQVWMSIKYPTPQIARKRQPKAVRSFDACDRLPKITSPTLVQTGDKDLWVPTENSRILDDRIPNAQLKIYKDVGHLFFVEKQSQFLDVVLKFLQ